MDTSQAPQDADDARYLQRVVATVQRLAPGALLGWLVSMGVVHLTAASPPGLSAVVYRGATSGLVLWLALAVVSLAVGLRGTHVPDESERRPGLTELTIMQLAAVAVAGALWVPGESVAAGIVPHTIDLRDAFVGGVGAGLAAMVAGAFVALLASRRGASWPTSLSMFLGPVIAWRVFGSTDLHVMFQGRRFLLTVAFLLGTSTASVLLLWRIRPTTIANRAVAAGFVAIAGCIGWFFLAFGNDASGRTQMLSAFPGSQPVVEAIRSLGDLDSDGFAGILGGGDCDDNDPQRYPGQVEIVDNGVDDNCWGGDLESVPEPHVTNPSYEGRRNILIVTIDAWRPDSLRKKVRGQPVMPRLEEFAEHSAVFERAYTPAPYTIDSLRSLISGRYPIDYTQTGTYFGMEPTLGELAASRGYDTAVLQQIYNMGPYVTFGFDDVDNSLAIENRLFGGRTSDAMTDKALERHTQLQASGQPYVLWVHYFDPHSDYLPRENAPFGGESRLRRYFQEVWATDRAVGRLLAGVEDRGFFDDGIAVITGDHGESLGEHGQVGHGYFMTEEVMGVPLILRGPDVAAGVYEQPVSLIDLYPTLADIALGVGVSSDGLSLARLWDGDEAARQAFDSRQIFGQSYYYQKVHKWSVWDWPWKLTVDIDLGTARLQDLSRADAHRHNLVEQEPEITVRLRQAIGHRWDISHNNLRLEEKLERYDDRRVSLDVLYEQAKSVLNQKCELGDAESCKKLEKWRREGPPPRFQPD